MTTKKTKDKPPVRRKAKIGRPVRTDNPQKITLHLALDLKRRAYDLACKRRCSISRLVEDLIGACK